MNENNLTLSLVVPCYNEEENIELYLKSINKIITFKSYPSAGISEKKQLCMQA